MLSDIENGKVGTVIVKDMSRFGRDFLKVGYYTEVMFAEHGVHFIAVNDGDDSEKAIADICRGLYDDGIPSPRNYKSNEYNSLLIYIIKPV